MPPAPLALLALCACAELFQVLAAHSNYTGRSIKALEDPSPGSCLYEGRWFPAGAAVRARAACLRCACAGGALSCRRRACAPLPDPPPRCHVLHRKGACCPELHCPDGVKLMELGASSRFEDEDYSDISSVSAVGHVRFPACVEGGTVYSAGSALASAVACEQCFCLGGARRCVRPRCLPPPPGCEPRPAPGACCPQRYYCQHDTPPPHGTHDCEVDGTWFSEGSRVAAAERRGGCAHCFCLRGEVRCQPLACAPPLLGCRPLLRDGECCPHQYHCEHTVNPQNPISHNSLISVRNDDRSLHTSKSSKQETSTKSVSTNISTKTSSPITLATKKMPVTTTKVKRKTNESPSNGTSQKPAQDKTTTTVAPLPPSTVASTTEKLIRSNFETSTTEDLPDYSTTSTEQPEGSVRIMINGTINCTAELSSTSLPLNLTANETEKIKMELQPRIPILTAEDIESHTFNPNDIITDRSVNGDFDENEMFTINVTSSLSTNSSRATPGPAITTVFKASAPTDLPTALNISKKTNEFDFDYAEPTLPPSLPNLKIIPFVAADAVVDDDDSPKDELTYPILEREDKYPVYYPSSLEAKVTPFASRRKDVYQPTQYPVFTSEKVDISNYPTLSHEIDITSSDYPTANNDLLHEHIVSTSVGTHASDISKAVTNTPGSSTTFKLEAPSVNLFSPPVETEGGFVPKGPGSLIHEYYAVYPSTPSGPSVPHHTTSMQLDTVKECISSDGHRVLEGESVTLACSTCACMWGEMHCSPRPCPTPAGCRRSPVPTPASAAVPTSATSADDCCGELICDPVTEKETTPTTARTTTSTTTTEKSFINENENQTVNESHNKTILPQNGTSVDRDNSNLDNNDAKDTGKDEIEVSRKPIDNNDTVKISTTIASTEKVSTISSTKSTTITTTAVPDIKEIKETNYNPTDYEEEEDDEGFSFGSVLKLLLSDSYDATTASPYKNKPVTVAAATKPPPPRVTTTPPPMTTSIKPPKPSVSPFVPMPHHYPYMPPKKTFQQNTVNRIDHLVLGEATAIKKTTMRPTISAFKPVTATFKPVTRVTTQRPFFTTRTTTTRKEVQTSQQTVSPEGPRPPAPSVLPGVGGLLKLAGCNIYGRMYRVGRIIAELSTACQECRCTELGVQCRSLPC
ncbi:uncharacterized protein isoform X1 [Choristoneura fumiferana]|uniref:uncharacterized protein isoform X1 n=1 Tax=Choristoneura fumiferana TaxID=7141 RepID=UPI003D15E054